MLKVPTFVLGGLLILTGLAGYLFQDPGLSIKLTGPFADDAKLTLSDGTETHKLDLGFASSDAPGEHAYWLISRLNTTHAKDASQGNYAVDQGSDRYKKKSFWYGSSKGETLAALMQDAENYQNASNKPVPIEWSKVDKDSSTIRFVYKNETGNSGPATLQVSNWKNVDIEPKPKPNEKLEFGRSWTALIPAIIGIVLILLVLLAEAKPNARKHIMHGAVLFGLLSFAEVAKRVWPAISEMNWLKGEPNAIIQTSLLKPAAMVISAGILLIFVILCVVSFIQARKDMAAQAKKEALTKKKESKDKPEDKGEKKKDNEKDKDASEDSDTKDDSDKPKRPDGSGDPAKESTKSKPKGLSIRKPVDQTGKKASFDLKSKKAVRTPEDSDDKKGDEEKKKAEGTETETKKDSGEDTGSSKQESENLKIGGGDSGERKDSDEQPDKDSPSPVSEESEETQEKNEDDSEKEPKKDSEKDTGFSYKKPEDGTSGDSGERKDSDEQADKNAPSPAREESEETPEKKEDDSDAGEKEESGEPKDSSNDKPEGK